jgi:hypothetical protein
VIFVGALATFVYLDRARLQARATDLLETAKAFVSPERAPSPAVAAVAPAVPAPEPASASAPPRAPAAVAPAPTEPPPPAAAPASEATAPPAAVAAVQSAAEPQPAPTITRAAPAEPPAPVQTVAPPRPVAAAAAAAPAPTRFEFAERTLTVNEWEASARIVIRRTGSLDEEAAVVWWTADRSAIADQDYAVLGARVERFAAGEDTRVVHVPLIADSMPEQRESFVVNLRTERAGGAGAQLEVFVLDDDR